MKKIINFVGRKNELHKLSEFYHMQGAVFLHLRGRRRIGGKKGDVYDFMLFFENFNRLPIKA